MLISEKEQLLKELKSLRSSKDKTANEKLEIREQIAKLEQEIKGESGFGAHQFIMVMMVCHYFIVAMIATLCWQQKYG